MRVTGTVSGANDTTPRFSQRTTEPVNNLTVEREKEVVVLVELRQELAMHKEAEIRIKNLPNSQSGDDGRTSCGEGKTELNIIRLSLVSQITGGGNRKVSRVNMWTSALGLALTLHHVHGRYP